jgi:hypothetical protein
MASTPSGNGYYLVASDGGVFSFPKGGAPGAIPFYGSAGGTTIGAPAVSIVTTPTGNGYWIAAANGRVFNYGGATNYGSQAGTALQAPIVGFSGAGNAI